MQLVFHIRINAVLVYEMMKMTYMYKCTAMIILNPCTPMGFCEGIAIGEITDR